MLTLYAVIQLENLVKYLSLNLAKVMKWYHLSLWRHSSQHQLTVIVMNNIIALYFLLEDQDKVCATTKILPGLSCRIVITVDQKENAHLVKYTAHQAPLP